MNPQFDIATLVGVGLLGGSLGLALQAEGMATRVRGVGRRRSSLDTALSAGAIHEAYLDLDEAVRDAALIVICTPAAIVNDTLDAIRGHCRADAVVTDVASTKASICAHAQRTWDSPRRFVGSHPMAGSEKFGPEHAIPTLYRGCVTFVEEEDGQAEDAHAAVCRLWERLGARVINVDPQVHDQCVARTSHVPHVVAACVAELAASGGVDLRPYVGSGFRDVTRIAEGRAEVWRDICLTNRDAIAEGLRALGAQLEAVERAVDAGDAQALLEFFESASRARRQVLPS